jgi:hypothetical protein
LSVLRLNQVIVLLGILYVLRDKESFVGVFVRFSCALYSRDWASSFSVDCLVCSLIINYAKYISRKRRTTNYILFKIYTSITLNVSTIICYLQFCR